MALIEKMTTYYKFDFPTTESAHRASDKLMNFVTTDAATILTMVGQNRVVVWQGSTDFDNKVLYLSEGAMTLLKTLHVAFPVPQQVAASALPDQRALTLGDASDWNNK